MINTESMTAVHQPLGTQKYDEVQKNYIHHNTHMFDTPLEDAMDMSS